MTHRCCFNFFPHLPLILSFNARPNTSWTPVPVLAEHSIYRAPISFATLCPCSADTGAWPCAPNIRLVCSSLRRSIFVATSMRGVPSQKCATSGNHLWKIHVKWNGGIDYLEDILCLAHCLGWQGNQSKTLWEWHRFLDSSVVVIDHILPDQPYPTRQVLFLCRRSEPA